MGKTRFLLPLMVVVLFPTFGNTLSADSPQDINTDQLALLALRSHVTHDPRNLLATNWSTSTFVCNWIGVTCESRHHRVTALNLSGMGLTGTIPPHQGNLSFLSCLDVSNNSFHGSLPIELGYLRRLKYLDFGNNSFSGEIPSTLGHLSKLVVLNLTNNYFKGKIPAAVGNLSSLKCLYLHNNQLSGEIPSVTGNLTSLKALSLFNNSLTGIIPSTIGSMTSLIDLKLGFNKLQGRIPTLPPSLLLLGLSFNKLDGEIPSSICNTSSLGYIGLAENNLGGIILECLGNLSLHDMYLHTNNFHGKIPDTLFLESCLLTGFHISSNQLEGTIPQSLVNCKDLEIVDLRNNKLNDTFPSWLGNLKNLQILVLRSNGFHGHIANIPEVESSFAQLRIIDLSHNDFSGSLPTKFFANLHAIINSEKKGDSGYMKFYYYDGSYAFREQSLAIKGLETQYTRILPILTDIDFSNNQFNEEIPAILGELHSLVYLNLSHNSLKGHIPSSLGNLSMLESLDLSSNKLQGRIPAQLVNLNFLEVLDLSCNNLTGLIPRSNHFDTFTNDSYCGNLGLCGFPLSKGCGNDQVGLEPPPTKFDARRELNWKFSILMGYGCGVVFGISMGYIVFTTGKPWWFIQIIERVQQKYTGRKICKSGGRKLYS